MREHAAPTSRSRRRLGERDLWIVLGLVAVVIGLMAYKLSGLPGSQAFADWFSFQRLPPDMRARTYHLLFTPLGALAVVFVRVTLGIRVLGPFRSVLLAIAFQMTGAAVGVAFFALVIGVVVAVRPAFKRMRLPYFGRSAAMLVAVASMVLLGMLAGMAMGIREVERVAYFPVVVLTLAGDAFAVTMRKEGWRSAYWRAGATVLLALAITWVASFHGLRSALVRFPELVLLMLAGIILICEFMSLRLFQHLNPPPVRKTKRKSRAPARALEGASGVPVGTPPAQ